MAESGFDRLRRHGLAFPEAEEDFPWGHTALKVRGKTFAWLTDDDGFNLTVKLPVVHSSVGTVHSPTTQSTTGASGG